MLYYLIRIAQSIAGKTPRRLRWWIGETIAQAIYWGWVEKRIATQKNMHVILDLPLNHPVVRLAARISWRNYGRFIADFFDLPNHPASYYLDLLHENSATGIDALDAIDAMRGRGQGVMLTTGHYGSWDAAGVMVASRGPIWALAEPVSDERTNNLIQSQRKAVGLNIIPIEHSLRPMMRVLRAGEVLAAPIDRPAAAGEGVPVRFFGRTAYVPRGLGAIAVKVDAVVLSGYAAYDGMRGFTITVFPPVTIERTDDPDADIIRATQVMFDALEVMVRRDPTQWYMFRQFWPDTDNDADKLTPAAAQVSVTAAVTAGAEDARDE